MEGNGPPRMEPQHHMPDSMLCEEQFAENAQQHAPSFLNGEKMHPPPETYEHSFPFHTFPVQDQGRPEKTDKDLPTLQSFHSITHPLPRAPMPHETKDQMYILPPIRPAPPSKEPQLDWQAREREKEALLEREREKERERDREREREREREKEEAEERRSEMDYSNDSEEEQIELMRENIQLRRKNTILMNQNMHLILDLKDKEHKIFRQQLLLAKYRKRFINMFEQSDQLYESESEEELSESESDSAVSSPVAPSVRPRTIETPSATASTTTTTTTISTPSQPMTMSSPATSSNNITPIASIGGPTSAPIPMNTHNHNHNNINATPPPLPPSTGGVMTPHRVMPEQFSYSPSPSLPHTPSLSKELTALNNNINKRKRLSGGRGRGGGGAGGVLKRSRSNIPTGFDGSPAQGGGELGADQGEMGEIDPLLRSSYGNIQQGKRGHRGDVLSSLGRHRDSSGIYPLSPPPEEADDGYDGTVVSGFPVPHSLKERQRKGRKSTLWSAEDDEKFLKAYALYGKSWKLIHTLLPDKTREQVQSHGQYLIRTGKIDDVKKSRKGRKHNMERKLQQGV